ncbi:Protein TOPLESS [Platanthera guangdongensis]|uniref:Protein TOPLESS n=1 Tax=Platanthera guangdongensis TaxID=2320717 RepID=A0ABR2LCZ9_9ASPA
MSTQISGNDVKPYSVVVAVIVGEGNFVVAVAIPVLETRKPYPHRSFWEKGRVEIDAHSGGVNDISLSQPNKQLCVVTCGDDKTIKVWDAITGVVQYTYEGHEAPVYSICPHSKENIHFIFSTSLDGKIKAWLYDNGGSRVDYTAPGQWCTTMAYSADGTRLFSCGTSKEGDSYIVEWNESEGSVKRTYSGFQKRLCGYYLMSSVMDLLKRQCGSHRDDAMFGNNNEFSAGRVGHELQPKAEEIFSPPRKRRKANMTTYPN